MILLAPYLPSCMGRTHIGVDAGLVEAVDMRHFK